MGLLLLGQEGAHELAMADQHVRVNLLKDCHEPTQKPSLRLLESDRAFMLLSLHLESHWEGLSVGAHDRESLAGQLLCRCCLLLRNILIHSGTRDENLLLVVFGVEGGS